MAVLVILAFLFLDQWIWLLVYWLQAMIAFVIVALSETIDRTATNMITAHQLPSVIPLKVDRATFNGGQASTEQLPMTHIDPNRMRFVPDPSLLQMNKRVALPLT